jgi:hypothetical protein
MLIFPDFSEKRYPGADFFGTQPVLNEILLTKRLWSKENIIDQ